MLLNSLLQLFAVESGTVGAHVRYEESAGGWIAADDGVFARDFVVGVKREIHRLIFAAAADAYAILHDRIRLRTGIVLIFHVCVNCVDPAGGGYALGGGS